MSNRRIQRVSKLVKEQVGEILEELSLVDCGFVTVTDAAISPDLKTGHIYVSVIGTDTEQRRALAELARQHGHIQQALAARIVLKYTPRLTFHLDDTGVRAAHIDQLLDELDQEKSAS